MMKWNCLQAVRNVTHHFFLNTVVIRRGAGLRGVSEIVSGCVSGESEWPV